LPVTEATLPAFLGDEDGAGVAGDAFFKAGGDERGLGDQEGHRLALHVRTHQGAVGIVVLEERDQGGSDRDQLLGRHVHVVDLLGLDVDEIALAAAGDAFGEEVSLVVDRAFAWAMT
jgi:hypothetical protein